MASAIDGGMTLKLVEPTDPQPYNGPVCTYCSAPLAHPYHIAADDVAAMLEVAVWAMIEDVYGAEYCSTLCAAMADRDNWND